MSVTRMVITVAREEGSGGREIAQELARKLKLTYVDDQLIKLATGRLGIPAEELADFDEKVLPRMPEISQMLQQFRDMPLSSILAPDRDVYGIVKEKPAPPPAAPVPALTEREANMEGYQVLVERLITEVAEHGHAVIVGRGANFILKNWPGVIHLFFRAPLQDRIERVAYVEHLDKEAAARRVTELDIQRAAFIKQTFGADWANPDHYHLVVNTSQMPLAAATASVAQFVKAWDHNYRVIDPLAMHLTYDRLAAKELYTVKEVAELLLISPDMVRQAVYRGEIKGTIMSHNITRIKREALLEWLRRPERRVELQELVRTS